MESADADKQAPTQRVRRRASRAAGPAKSESGESDAGETTVGVTAAPSTAKRPAKPARSLTAVRPPPRRPAHRKLVGWLSAAAGLVLAAALGTGVAVLMVGHRDAEAVQARQQRFVDTATQTVVNMFSYTPDTIDQAVNRFVDGTSGPLRGMLSANNNVE
ncbi:mammalian cell entry protein, partial [Mycolicibacterium setense]|uniref:mammalian cell entry protein n=1 Tax=Mycolicibacterium setense TaxID=431269 RepID=UPI0021F38E19